ncbi:MAG: hypothetical protein ACYTAN_18770 [Planctomycetota bacterium]
MLTFRDPRAVFFIAAHTFLIVSCCGRLYWQQRAFLFTRGYGRDTLWLNMLSASFASVLAAWLPAALAVWTPLRSASQDRLLRSPEFPIMAPVEAGVPWFWLASYVLLLALFHYAWIRRSQPTRGTQGGVVLSFGVIAAACVLLLEGNIIVREGWLVRPIGAAAASATVVLLWASLVLHRRLEVRT